MAKRHATRAEQHRLARLMVEELLRIERAKHGLHAQAVGDGKARRKRPNGAPRKRPGIRWKGFAAPKQGLREERPSVTATKAAELETYARKHFGG